jgi:hypothetical protein
MAKELQALHLLVPLAHSSLQFLILPEKHPVFVDLVKSNLNDFNCYYSYLILSYHLYYGPSETNEVMNE